MDDKIFIDTWGWIVIHNKRETRHSEVTTFYKEYRLDGGIIYTTDYVIDETFTMLFRRLPFLIAAQSMTLLDSAIKQGYLLLERISPQRFDKAKQLRLKLKDKPDISFTDLTSMVVMSELHLFSILTEDAHFNQVGMGFKNIP